jgi:hypothetical protein
MIADLSMLTVNLGGVQALYQWMDKPLGMPTLRVETDSHLPAPGEAVTIYSFPESRDPIFYQVV